MRITVNGDEHTFPDSLNIVEMLGALEMDKTSVIVEINERVAKKKDWLTTNIKEGDVIELISVVGGG